jgi:1-deoxy-D-xylulose-5-phosphate reductoisomerase
MNIAVLGSTGSIGRNVLNVAENLPGVEVFGISANRNMDLFKSQITKYAPSVAVIADNTAYKELKNDEAISKDKVRLLSGIEGILELVACEEVDVVVNGLSGIAGLMPTLKALESGKKVASANKESIVMGWNFLSQKIQYEEQLVPVDSEHSAVFQGLKGELSENIYRIILTASGGAVYNYSMKELETVTAETCLAHPTWNMGSKITIDSATLMNKGLEVIEANRLFGVDYSKIDVYIHPQSIIHGMVEYIDGTVIACLAEADMRIPIQYALTHPKRQSSPAKKITIENMKKLTFSLPDNDRFPCLRMAVEAGEKGGETTAVLCAADEVAVDSFLKGRIGFKDIAHIIHEVLEKEKICTAGSPADIEEIYKEAVRTTGAMIGTFKQ